VSSRFCRLISFCMAMIRNADSTLAMTSWAWKGLEIMSSAPRFRPPILEASPSMAETSTKKMSRVRGSPFTAWQSSSPAISGMRRSERMRSGCSLAISSRASLPFSARSTW